MSLRQAAQQALEALEKVKTDADKQPPVYPWDIWRMWVDRAITNLLAALAEPDSDYERGFVDGMNLQTKGSVDKAVNRMAQTTHWEGCEAVHPECKATPRKPLTDEEIWKCLPPDPDELAFARAIERAHGIGGGE